jgi:hypothetical protein
VVCTRQDNVAVFANLALGGPPLYPAAGTAFYWSELTRNNRLHLYYGRAEGQPDGSVILRNVKECAS